MYRPRFIPWPTQPAHRLRVLQVAAVLAIALGPWRSLGNDPDAGANPAPVTVHEDAEQIELHNGLVSFSLGKRNKEVTSIRYRVNGHEIKLSTGMHFDANRETEGARTRNARPGLVRLFQQPGARLTVIHSGPDQAEVVAFCDATSRFAFRTEAHWILRRNDPGFYVYIVFRHGPGMAAVSLVQARTVLGAPAGNKLFTHYIVDDQRMYSFPTGDIVETIQDATDRYASGQIYTKYDYSAFVADDLVYGMAGNGVGLWMILPGREYINGGPLHQELTVHKGMRGTGDTKGNILLWMFQGTHFGAASIDLKAGEVWNQCYGPAFVYCNQGDSVAAMWQDAKQRARAEEAQWPYSFVSHPEYPLRRATVSGRIQLADGRNPKGAWAVLSPPGTTDWCMAGRGYTFWSKTDESGAFAIPKVRPGRYTLFVSGANEFVDYRKDGIAVSAGTNLDLGTLLWTPVTHGRTLWQIGVADRSTREFKSGDNMRHYDNFIRYVREFPQDVTFTIGRSQESEDWNFAQWGWYAKNPQWTIRFDEPKALTGRATLTLGVCASLARRLEVKVNGRTAGVLDLPKTGAAPYRSAGQDSEYHVYPVSFDAGWLRAGTNEITLGIQGAVPFANPDQARPGKIGAVMYDALRLEVQDEL